MEAEDQYCTQNFDALARERFWYTEDTLLDGGRDPGEDARLPPGGSLLPWAADVSFIGHHMADGIMLPPRQKPVPFMKVMTEADILTPQHSLTLKTEAFAPACSPESSSEMDQDHALSQALVKVSGQQVGAGCDEIDKQRERNR